MIPPEAYLLTYVVVAIAVGAVGVLTIGPVLTVAAVGGLFVVGTVVLWFYWAWAERRAINAEH